jgi:hypothetical protein
MDTFEELFVSLHYNKASIETQTQITTEKNSASYQRRTVTPSATHRQHSGFKSSLADTMS